MGGGENIHLKKYPMRLIRSIGFACNGLKRCFAAEANFKIHVLLGIITILMGIGLHISTAEWLVVLICFALVLMIEMINTAIEKLCDVVQPTLHPGIKFVKDISAGAVLVAAMVSLTCGIIIFSPKIIDIVKSF
jgi:diacylglycerol kinase